MTEKLTVHELYEKYYGEEYKQRWKEFEEKQSTLISLRRVRK